MTVEQYGVEMKSKVGAMIKELQQTLEPEFIPYIEANFNASKRKTKRNNTDKLFDNHPDGGLLSSFRSGKKDSITDVSSSADGIRAVFGTKRIYAAVHEFGKTIKFKKRNGEVQMPERPYLRPAVREFQERGLDKWVEPFLDEFNDL